MNTIIFIVTFEEVDKIQTIKNEIVTYLGIRMIANMANQLPILILNSELTEADKTKLCEIIQSFSETGTAIITDKIESFGSKVIEYV